MANDGAKMRRWSRCTVRAIQVPVYPVPDDKDKVGRTANAIVVSAESPTGAWCAEWEPEVDDAWPLATEDGAYIPVPSSVVANYLDQVIDIRDVVTPVGAAEITGLCESTWRNRCAAGAIQCFKKGKQWLIPRFVVHTKIST